MLQFPNFTDLLLDMLSNVNSLNYTLPHHDVDSAHKNIPNKSDIHKGSSREILNELICKV